MQKDLGNKVTQFMTDTQSVFDSLLKDISTLRKKIEDLEESHDIESLETHLTERIATLTENSMETAAVQAESLESLHAKIASLVTETSNQGKRNREEVNQQIAKVQSSVNHVQSEISEVHKSSISAADEQSCINRQLI